jgi:transposase
MRCKKIHCNTPKNQLSFSLSRTEGGMKGMLSMDDIKYIRRMHEVEGCSIREITRRSGYHYETIKKYLDKEDFNARPLMIKEASSLLDPLKPIIDKWLDEDLKAPRKQRHTAKRVYERLQEEYETQLEVKLRTVQYYVSKKKKELYEEKSKGYIPLEHPAGEAQVDFCQFFYYDNANTLQEGRKLTVSFPQSNGAYCQIFRGENQECLLQGLQNIIKYMNKVPFRMVFDNLSAAVSHIGTGKERTLTEGFKRFVEHYKIEPVFCNTYSGWEKGNVENKVGYERRNMFVPVPTILDFDAFNEKLFAYCEKDMKRLHYHKKQLIAELFAIDKEAMLPLNPIEFKIFKLQSAKADKYGKVMFETNRYSSAPNLAQTIVYLEIGSDTVKILNQNYETVVTHKRLYEKNEESMDWLPYITLMAKRPTAIKYTGFYQELPDCWQSYLSELPTDKRREALLTLSAILQKHDITTATAALESAIRVGVKDADSILASYHRLTAKVIPMQPLQIEYPQMQIPSFQTDNKQYDYLFQQEVCQ